MTYFLRGTAILLGLATLTISQSASADMTWGHVEPLKGPVSLVRMRDVVVGTRYAIDVMAGLPVPSGLIHRVKVALGLADQRVLIAVGYSGAALKYMASKKCSFAGSYTDFYATIRPAQMTYKGQRVVDEEGDLPLYYIDDLRLVDPQACVKGRIASA
ncbi:hypothetical protein [Sphingomonas sp. CFBP 8760]|uniref:hypothetical protein n=1 Tax=Sphingomonas sp. CFBP 8760 TaxID=2775282 RepID=UPI00177E1EA7|nr:hypothetical protein [Sphingomonas sp. CFBP 8760]MBD8546028.1 hypothetical protein [Sphingomonas sp. CFBP 8760]